MTKSVVESHFVSVHPLRVFTKAELLAALEAKGVRPSAMARALDLPSSRISEIRRKDGKTRDLSYDEGVKLIHAFGLEQSLEAVPLPSSILRLAVRHIALKLKVPATEAQIADLAEDLRAFSEYVANPKVRQSVEAAEGFFQALQFRRPAREEEAPQRSDPERDQSP